VQCAEKIFSLPLKTLKGARSVELKDGNEGYVMTLKSLLKELEPLDGLCGCCSLEVCSDGSGAVMDSEGMDLALFGGYRDGVTDRMRVIEIRSAILIAKQMLRKKSVHVSKGEGNRKKGGDPVMEFIVEHRKRTLGKSKKGR
jgi:hypothetical protein